MRYCRIQRYDIKNGFLHNWLFLLVPVCIIVFCSQCTKLLNAWEVLGSWAIYVSYCFKGMQTISRHTLSEGFQVPVFWLFMMILPLLITLNYPFRDMKTIGPLVLLKSGSRVQWWLSKCVWNLSCTVGYFLLLYGTVAIYCVSTHVPLTMETAIGPVMALFVDADVMALVAEGMSMGQRCFVLLLLPFVTVASMNMLEMLLSLLIGPAYSFLICVALYAASSYVTTPLLLGNFANLTRSGAFINEGLDGNLGLVLCMVTLAGSIVIGVLCFHRRDILPDYKEL